MIRSFSEAGDPIWNVPDGINLSFIPVDFDVISAGDEGESGSTVPGRTGCGGLVTTDSGGGTTTTLAGVGIELAGEGTELTEGVDFSAVCESGLPVPKLGTLPVQKLGIHSPSSHTTVTIPNLQTSDCPPLLLRGGSPLGPRRTPAQKRKRLSATLVTWRLRSEFQQHSKTKIVVTVCETGNVAK